MFQCEGVRRTYASFVALDRVDLCVGEGEFVGVAGPNGAGKTTLLDVIGGRTSLSSGKLLFENHDITRMGASRRSAHGIGRSFQSPLVPAALTVDEAFAAAAIAHRPHLRGSRVDHFRTVIGPEVPGNSLCGELNTLDRRRLQLACSAIRNPKLLLLDEPCSGLFHEEIVTFEGIVRQVAESTGTALLVVEHRLELLHALTPRVLVLAAGKEIADGPPDEVFALPQVRAAYFDVPERGTIHERD